jgi:hypothetical protein
LPAEKKLVHCPKEVPEFSGISFFCLIHMKEFSGMMSHAFPDSKYFPEMPVMKTVSL